MSKTPPTLNLEQALERMRTGARLLHTHGVTKTGKRWFVTTGGAVSDAVAKQLCERPDVIGAKDGLFPGHDQTWRMVDFIDPSSKGE
jgi:hypothetical protein